MLVLIYKNNLDHLLMKKQNESLVRVLFRETKVNFLNLKRK